MKDNDIWFFDSHERDKLFNRPDGPRSGMWKIAEEKIKPGHRYFRFGDSSAPEETNLSSPWWIDYETFRNIVHWGQQAGVSDGYLARLRLAVAYQFGRCDLIVRATFTARLRAYTGPGGVILGNPNASGETIRNGMIWAPPQDVKQYFIPAYGIPICAVRCRWMPDAIRPQR